ncbi:hypothetical protein [Xanthobacter sp. 91]|uniref:hypothetical protein n=1 Tax=Xanthobacter sp. 91 TaxID=1117244 RepID=UPI0012DCAEEB|nr:hypothetical protein [Xanthobacter sp. 91]
MPTAATSHMSISSRNSTTTVVTMAMMMPHARTLGSSAVNSVPMRHSPMRITHAPAITDAK